MGRNKRVLLCTQKETKISQGWSEWERLLCLLSTVDVVEAWLCLSFSGETAVVFKSCLHPSRSCSDPRGCAASVRSSQCSAVPGTVLARSWEGWRSPEVRYGGCWARSMLLWLSSSAGGWALFGAQQGAARGASERRPLNQPCDGCCGISIWCSHVGPCCQ